MSEHIGHSGVWGLAIIMIVVASWLFYRYFAPKNWREWAGAGLVQAFIIALYAEDVRLPAHHLSVGAILSSRPQQPQRQPLVDAARDGRDRHDGRDADWLRAPNRRHRPLHPGWRELYLAHEQKRLATDGLYGLVRHPQYSGLFLGLFGEGVVHWPTVFSVILFPLIVLIYTLLAYREERQMLKEFGEQYRLYQVRVPMFFPSWHRWRQFIEHSQSEA